MPLFRAEVDEDGTEWPVEIKPPVRPFFRYDRTERRKRRLAEIEARKAERPGPEVLWSGGVIHDDILPSAPTEDDLRRATGGGFIPFS